MPSSTVPVLPLRELVVYPFTEGTILLGRPASVAAIDAALEEGSSILLVAQKDANVAEPLADDLFAIGTLGAIVRHVRLPRAEIKIVVRGGSRVRVERCIAQSDGSLRAEVSELVDLAPASSAEHRKALEQALTRHPGLRTELPESFESDTHLAFAAAAALPMRDFGASQRLLEAETVAARLAYATELLESAPKTRPKVELDEVAEMEALLRARIKKRKK